MTLPVARGAEMDPYTPGTGAPVYIRPHGRGARLPQYPKHRAEELSARRGGKQSKGEKNLTTFFRANNDEPPCFSDKCSRQARTEPFHTAHYSTGQRHS